MLEVSGKVRVKVKGLEGHGKNLVLNGGVEKLLAGTRVWHMLEWAQLGTGTRATRPHHEGLEAPEGSPVRLSSKEEFFDKELGAIIIRCSAEFQGPLQGISEIGWGSEHGFWNRITTEQLEGVPASISIEGDETLQVQLDVQIRLTKKPVNVNVLFEGKPIAARIQAEGLGNPLAWSAKGIGANKGLGYWGTAIGIQGTEEDAPRDAELVGELLPYGEGDFSRKLKVVLGPKDGNKAGGIKAIYFGTSHEGTRNVGWLWRLEFLEPFNKTVNSKLWLELGWGIVRG